MITIDSDFHREHIVVRFTCSGLEYPAIFHRLLVVYQLCDMETITLSTKHVSAVLYVAPNRNAEVEQAKFYNTMMGNKVDEAGDLVRDAEGRVIQLDLPVDPA